MTNDSLGEIFAPGLVQLAALGVEGSITRAAARSGTSQPSLSRAVRRWETELGVALVVPRGRRVEVTAEGQLLAAAAGAALASLEAAGERIRGGRTRPTVRVGFLRSLGPTVVGELVSSFLAERPDTVFSHREESTVGLLEALDAREIDVAVTAPQPPHRFAWLRLGSQAMVLLVPSGHRLADSTGVSVAELRDETFLALDSRFNARQLADRLCAEARIRPRILLEADDLTTVANYIGAGLGVALLPADSSSHPRTVAVPVTDEGARREFGVVWRPDESNDTTAAFVAFARALGERYPGWADIDV